MNATHYKNKLIPQKRAELNLPVAKIAQELGLTRQHYYDIESGVSVSYETLSRVCQRLGISMSDILITEDVVPA